MKNILLQFCSAFCFLAFLNCSNDAELPKETTKKPIYESVIDETTSFDNVSKLKIGKVLEMSDKEERKIAYRLLNKQEKIILWENKLNLLISENKMYGLDIELNKQQKELLKEAKSYVCADFFDENQSDKKEFIKNILIPDFITRSTKVFPEILMGSIFYEISLPSIKVDVSQNNVSSLNELKHRLFSKDAEPNEICDCGSDHFFSCSWGQYDDYCKEKKRCIYVTSGCGFMAGFDCNGICTHF